MDKYSVTDLSEMLAAIGEDDTQSILSDFLCPKNHDIENFLRKSAIDFHKKSIAKTHLVFASHEGIPVLVVYFTLTSKILQIPSDSVHGKAKKCISRFSQLDETNGSYQIPAPLIAQLGKNYADGYNKLITGKDLLEIALDAVKTVQRILGGKITYIERDDEEHLKKFYEDNGFAEFATRPTINNSNNGSGKYLVQMLKVIE